MRTGSLILIALACGGASALRLQSSNVNHDASMVDIQSEAAKPVFYIIVMGDLAYRHQVSLWLSSVRLLGGFKDEVVIVTDRPTCLAKTLQEAKLLGPSLSSTANVDIYGPGEGYTGNIHLVKRPHTKEIYKMKLEKTRAWANVRLAAIPHAVSSIIYTDEDIVVGKNLDKFMATVRSLEEKNHPVALFRDTGTSAGELHTGIVVIFPGQVAEACLQSWGKKLTTTAIARIEAAQARKNPWMRHFNEVEEKEIEGEAWGTDDGLDDGVDLELEMQGIDQQSLAKAKSCQSTMDSSSNKMMKKIGHEGINILPADMFWLPTSEGLQKDRLAEFIHFTNTNRWKSIKDATIKDYLERIGIPEYIDPLGTVKAKACNSEGKASE
eukprot:gnl/MRDRNA2_/MRDRNA2_85899_c0_seq5.p1 gnl/MRDRNA2_/MRDRNA2_85899_c0~~gnl/MRDRNA2_/MRDRNA2_85899_c0_seq5.p1  ORF type:complete len:381 (+),score=85.71 gnl/MRDRNA2_/MRDRNA2_85899_c0_seq5:89-1231(+)